MERTYKRQLDAGHDRRIGERSRAVRPRVHELPQPLDEEIQIQRFGQDDHARNRLDVRMRGDEHCRGMVEQA